MDDEQTSMFRPPTPEEAAANLRRFWESYLRQQLGAVAAVAGAEMPPGMVEEMARILAANDPGFDDRHLGPTLLLMSMAYEAGMLYERRGLTH